ncbi:hypothetical protein DPMN_128936 [Dreissena polymorpha]|uniref:Uncharacterized protein n=1 Tax=Dreissena polymorpha TaxID=45954 RepID=A0A9D4H403_DREPO|nr:hypothetical protein DPMN_128936 [Dreissena polymorpha]
MCHNTFTSLRVLLVASRYRWEIPFTYTTSSQPRFDVTSQDITWLHKIGNGS